MLCWPNSVSGSWCVTVDLDELLVYPGSEQASLRALDGLLLDPRRLRSAPLHVSTLSHWPAGIVLVVQATTSRTAPCFDMGPYPKSPFTLCPGVLTRGGMRDPVFTRSSGHVAGGEDGHDVWRRVRTPLLRDKAWLRAWRRPTPPCLEGSSYPMDRQFQVPQLHSSGN